MMKSKELELFLVQVKNGLLLGDLEGTFSQIQSDEIFLEEDRNLLMSLISNYREKRQDFAKKKISSSIFEEFQNSLIAILMEFLKKYENRCSDVYNLKNLAKAEMLATNISTFHKAHSNFNKMAIYYVAKSYIESIDKMTERELSDESLNNMKTDIETIVMKADEILIEKSKKGSEEEVKNWLLSLEVLCDVIEEYEEEKKYGSWLKPINYQ